jgi:Spy/CpxP family protein refolding chaperone
MKALFKKAALILAVLSLLATGTAVAQKYDGERAGKNGPPSVEDKLAHMSEALNLSDQQAVDMLQLLQQHDAERAALHDQTMALMGPEICAQKADEEDSILAILTPEQAEQFQQMKEQRKARATERDRGRGKNRPDCSDYDSDG